MGARRQEVVMRLIRRKTGAGAWLAALGVRAYVYAFVYPGRRARASSGTYAPSYTYGADDGRWEEGW